MELVSQGQLTSYGQTPSLFLRLPPPMLCKWVPSHIWPSQLHASPRLRMCGPLSAPTFQLLYIMYCQVCVYWCTSSPNRVVCILCGREWLRIGLELSEFIFCLIFSCLRSHYAKRKALLPEHLQYIYHLLLNIVSSASEIWVWVLSAPKADETFLKPSLNKFSGFSLWWELQVARVSVTAVPTLVLICHNTNLLLEKK